MVFDVLWICFLYGYISSILPNCLTFRTTPEIQKISVEMTAETAFTSKLTADVGTFPLDPYVWLAAELDLLITEELVPEPTFRKHLVLECACLQEVADVREAEAEKARHVPPDTVLTGRTHEQDPQNEKMRTMMRMTMHHGEKSFISLWVAYNPKMIKFRWRSFRSSSKIVINKAYKRSQKKTSKGDGTVDHQALNYNHRLLSFFFIAFVDTELDK